MMDFDERFDRKLSLQDLLDKGIALVQFAPDDFGKWRADAAKWEQDVRAEVGALSSRVDHVLSARKAQGNLIGQSLNPEHEATRRRLREILINLERIIDLI
jgi:hypothetical protein